MPGPNWWEYMTPEQRAEEFRRRWAAPAPVSPPPQPAAPMPIEGGIPSLPVPLLAGALDIMQRPNYAIAGMAQSALGQRPEGMLQAGWQGLMGQTRPTFGTVLEQAGVSELGRLGPITGRGVLGLGLDIITDPTTYLGIGAAGKLTKAGRLVSQVATKTAQAALPAETALGAVMATGRRAGQAGVREATALGAKGLVGEGGLTFAGKTVVPASTLEGVFKPLQQVFRRIPGEATIEESLGTLFVPGYKLKKAGAGEVYERMQDIRRLPKAVQAETARELAPLFEPLTEVQRRRFFELANTSTNIDDYVKEGLDDLGNYYLGTWRPKYDAIAQDLGIPLWESAFIHHMKADPTTQSIFDTFRKRAGEGKGVTGKTVEELEQAGMNVDALRAMSVEAASKQTILEMQTLLTDAINKYGAVVKRKGGVIPEGLVEFTPSGKWGEALRRTLKAPQGSTYYLPEPLANAFGVLGRPQETIGFLKYFDVVQGIWKGSVTSIFPEFHARNALGNVFNAWLGGNYNPMTYARGARLQFDEQYFDAAIKAEGTCKSREQFFDALRRKGGTGFGFFGGEYAATVPRAGGVVGQVGDFAGAPMRFGKNIGEGIENNAKIAFILDKLDKNFSLDDAIMESKKYLFDYTELTDFEKSTLRRLVPFYTWTRKNLPLQIEAMITQPGKAVSIGKMRTAANQESGLKKEEEALFPYWLQEQLNIVIGRDAEGDPKVMQGIGIPIEDINKLWRGKSLRTMERFLAEGSPLLRVPYEILTNRSLFTSKAITDPSVNNYYRRAYPLLADVPVLRDWLGLKKEEVVINGEKRNVYNADPQRMYLLNSIIGRMYTTVGKLSRENMDMVEKVMDFLMPGKQVNLDLDRAVVDFTLDMDKAMKDSNAKVETAARAFQAGKITGRQYRGVRTEAAQVRSINMDKLAEIAAEQQGIFPAEREANLQAIRTSDAAALHKYQTIEPDDPKYLDAETGLVDWDAYFGAKRSFLAGLSPNDRLYIEQHTKDYVKRLSPQAQKVELQYLKAKEAMDEYAQIPRFVGLTKEDEQAKERAEQIYNGVMSQLRARYPTATGQLLDKLRVMAWSEAGKSEPRGVALRKAKENPARVKFRNTHPEIALFYRDVLIPQQEG